MIMENTKKHVMTHLMLERLVGIHTKIKSGTYPNTKKLAEEFNEGKGTATISRDIEFLRDRFGAPIEYDPIHRGYYYSENFEMPLNTITSQKLSSLFAAKMMLANFKGSPLYEEVSNVIDSLAVTTTQKYSEFLCRIAIPPSPQVIVDDKVWDIVIESLQRNAIMEFDYKGRWNTETTHRKIRPYQLVLDDGKYFLYGYSEERNATRLFLLSRITNPKQSDKVFELPADYEFEPHCGGGKFGSFSSDTKDHYKIEFYENARQMIKDCIWADDQIIYDDNTRNCTTIEFSSTQFLKIEEWILSQGCYAKPIEPQWLVEDWKGHVREMWKMVEGIGDSK